MKGIVIEVRRPTGEWAHVGSVSEMEPPGSMSSDTPLGRRVIMFGWYGGEPGVWESVGGVDMENVAVREIATAGFTRLSDLAEPFEIDVVRPVGTIPTRFTLLTDS